MPGPILNPDIKVGNYYFQASLGVRTGNILWVTNINPTKGLYICDIFNTHEGKVFSDKEVPSQNIDSSCTVPEEIRKELMDKIIAKVQRACERRINELKQFFGKK